MAAEASDLSPAIDMQIKQVALEILSSHRSVPPHILCCACQTVIANHIANVAHHRADALEAVDEFAEDIRIAINAAAKFRN